jgi:hypothetical protein
MTVTIVADALNRTAPFRAASCCSRKTGGVTTALAPRRFR